MQIPVLWFREPCCLERVLELHFSRMCNGGEQMFCLPTSLPGFPGSKEKEWMPQHSATLESGPAITHTNYTLRPIQAAGKGMPVAAIWVGPRLETEETVGQERVPDLTREQLRTPSSCTYKCRPGRRRPRSRRGWRFPRARKSRRTLGRDLTWLLPTRFAREQNSGYLFTNIHADGPALQPDPQARTGRGFREAGPGTGKGNEGVVSTSGGKWRARGRPAPGSRRGLSSNTLGWGSRWELEVRACLADAGESAGDFFGWLIFYSYWFFCLDNVPCSVACYWST